MFWISVIVDYYNNNCIACVLETLALLKIKILRDFLYPTCISVLNCCTYQMIK